MLGEGLWDSVCEVYSSAHQCPGTSHSFTTNSLTFPKQLLILQAPIYGKHPKPFFVSDIVYFYCVFPMFRYTSTYHCATIACSGQYSNHAVQVCSLGAIGHTKQPGCAVG